jgi:hypothetical protein
VSPAVSLTLTEDQHLALRRHLLPGDGLEAVAFIACGRAAGDERHRLVARYLHLIPYDRCVRERDRVQWRAEDIELLMEHAEIDGLSLVKVHSHPSGYPKFSTVDDSSDAELLPTIRSWVEADVPHASAVMLPDGSMFGRYIWRDEHLNDFDLINVVGPDLKFWWRDDEADEGPAFAASQDQAFGEGTTSRLKRLRIGVIGASGTGSPVIEQLLRLGVGHVVPIDDDFIEDRNLNRILFATAAHAKAKTPKVSACAEDIERTGLGTRVTPIAKEISDPEALRAISQCDVVFGCVDTAWGRFILNLAATHYNLAYFDLGILLDAQQEGADRGRINDILGTVHFLVPGRSSLLSRGAFTMADVATEELHKRDPMAAAQQIQDKYIKGLQVRRPAVVSVDMFAAALAMNDFLARLHPYRTTPNADVASIEFSLAELRLTQDEELEDCPALARDLGRGDRTLWLGLPGLGQL